jgi:hypothetical protein
VSCETEKFFKPQVVAQIKTARNNNKKAVNQKNCEKKNLIFFINPTKKKTMKFEKKHIILGVVAIVFILLLTGVFNVRASVTTYKPEEQFCGCGGRAKSYNLEENFCACGCGCGPNRPCRCVNCKCGCQ